MRLKQLEDESRPQRSHHRSTDARGRSDERADRKKRLGLSQRQAAVRALQTQGLSLVRSCALIGYTRSNLYYRRKRKEDEPLSSRLQDLAERRPRWGWRRLLILLRREQAIGEYRFRRIYRSLGLQVRPRKKRKVRYVRGSAIAPVHAPNERWSLDFMHDSLASGRRLRVLMIIDDYTRECLATEIERGFSEPAGDQRLGAHRLRTGIAKNASI